MPSQFDLRQSLYRGLLDQIATATGQSADHLIAAVNNQLSPLLRMSAASVPSLVVSIGSGDVTDAESTRRRAIPHVGTAYIQFASGTVTFPASSGGNIVCSPGNNTVLTVASGNFAAVLIYIDGSGNLNALPGTDAATANLAIVNLPPSPDDTLPLGFVVVHNVAGVIQNIVQNQIAQFGTGTGGGGSGNVTSVETALRDYNNFAQTKYLDPNIFRQSKATKVDGSSTGVFDLVKNAFKFTSIGNTFVSSNLANAEFLADGVDITDVHLYLHWLSGFIDTAAVYEASRDGGTNWTTLTMTRVGTASNAYRGYKIFSDESVQQSVVTVAPTGAGSALNATTTQQLSSKLILSSTTVVRSIDLNLNYGGAGTGTFSVRIVKDSAGAPSTAAADLISESNAVTISTANLGTGNVTKTVTIPQVVLVAGTYHIVILTDAAYKAGTLDLSWRSGAGTNGANFNGTTWTTGQASKAFVQKGRVHDLRIRVTAGTALTYLEGMGVYFPSDDNITRANGAKYVQRFYFSGDSNTVSFDLNWVPDPDLLDIIDPYRGQIYAIEPGVAKINGQNITFAPNTFNFPGESIVLIFRQVKGTSIDNSDSNAANISTHTQNLLDAGLQISDLEFVTIPKINVANTTIQNRSQIADLSQDFNSRMGINRVMTQQVYPIQNELGPNGEPVWGSANDRFNQVRFVGTWSTLSILNGNYSNAGFPNDYCEITFYGTGLNLLLYPNPAGSADLRVSVDGGSEGANVYLTNATAIIGNRGYSINTVIPVLSGLSLGIHTAKIRVAVGAAGLYGFETVNLNSTNIVTNPGSQYVGGKKLTLASQQTYAYNTSFESGTLGTRGGRVLVYQKSDGTIAKAVTPTDASQLNLTSATHANEELVRVYSFREFGANRADDFSTLVGASSLRSFVLDDGTTALVTDASLVNTFNGIEGFVQNTTTNFVTLTFVGTGLDITYTSNTATLETHTLIIDNATVGTFQPAFSRGLATIKLVSGLPYGTHSVKIVRTTNAGDFRYVSYKAYQPKTPTLPVGARALQAYNIMADFVANATAGAETIATGVLRKYSTREMSYIGTWSISQTANVQGGWEVSTSTNASFMELNFFGTGFEFRFENNAAAAVWNVLVDGASNVSGFTTSSYGAGVTSFVAATGTLNISASATIGNGVRISGLALGMHTVRWTRTSGAGTQSILAMDVITPIHSHKSNVFLENQNTLPIGSQSIEDFRKVSALEQITTLKAVSQASGVAVNPSTASTTAIPMPDLSVTHKNTTGKIRISYGVPLSSNTVGGGMSLQVYIDGSAVGVLRTANHAGSGVYNQCDTMILYVSPGVHKIDVYWYVSTVGTINSPATGRDLLVEDI